MKLDCDFQVDNNKIRSEINLEQKEEDCSVIADVFPCENISNLTKFNCSLESILDSTELLLSETSGIIDDSLHHILDRNRGFKVKIPHAKIKAKSYPEPDKQVAIKFYLTNIPYFFQVYNINIPEQPKILIKPYNIARL